MYWLSSLVLVIAILVLSFFAGRWMKENIDTKEIESRPESGIGGGPPTDIPSITPTPSPTKQEHFEV
ncbi:hypothetical protein HY407_02185 [Candidatus Gottesmanbacteria bacterium]|nr:hypothetical protein [Candidatus Gottesmanbacteria bacterium]